MKKNSRAIPGVHVNKERLDKALKLWGGNIYDLSEELGKGRTTIRNIVSGNTGHTNPPAAFIKMICDRIHADYDWIVEPETPSPTPLEALEAQAEAPRNDSIEAILSELVKISEILGDILTVIYPQIKEEHHG